MALLYTRNEHNMVNQLYFNKTHTQKNRTRKKLSSFSNSASETIQSFSCSVQDI